MNKNEVSKKEKTRDLNALSFTLQRQDEQSKVLQEVIATVIETKDEIVDIRQEIKKDVQDLRDSITLNEKECLDMQSEVFAKALTFANLYYHDGKPSTNLFMSKVGQFRHLIWKKLKEKYKTRKYVMIRRIDYKEAMDFIKSIRIDWFEPHEIRTTPGQLRIIELERNVTDEKF